MFHWSLWTRSQTFAALVSKWCWQVLSADIAIRGRATGQSPSKFSETCSVVSSVEYTKVIICVYVENHGNTMLLSLQILAMLTWKEMPCVENLQIAYCVNMLPLSAQILRTTRTVAQLNLILVYLQHCNAMENHANKKLFEWNVILFVFGQIVYLLYNSQNLLFIENSTYSALK